MKDDLAKLLLIHTGHRIAKILNDTQVLYSSLFFIDSLLSDANRANASKSTLHFFSFAGETHRG
ncbi:MAG: hypothetical protein CFH35_02078 [Alphaproteobacteria bacterium MarineAlpha9_Bin5]|nr:MAG: hypothetical protein CFH35_02078 [Alphaproteobacteria bacterium MarineAlpha9_Bin5]